MWSGTVAHLHINSCDPWPVLPTRATDLKSGGSCLVPDRGHMLVPQNFLTTLEARTGGYGREFTVINYVNVVLKSGFIFTEKAKILSDSAVMIHITVWAAWRNTSIVSNSYQI